MYERKNVVCKIHMRLKVYEKDICSCVGNSEINPVPHRKKRQLQISGEVNSKNFPRKKKEIYLIS